MIMAIGGICLLANGEMLRFKKKEWGGFLLSVFVPLLLWFGWRFTKDGLFFLKNMIKVDLLARTGSTNFEGHQFPFSFYYDMVFGAEGFIYRWQLLICVVGILCGPVIYVAKKSLESDPAGAGRRYPAVVSTAVPGLFRHRNEAHLVLLPLYCAAGTGSGGDTGGSDPAAVSRGRERRHRI